MGRGPRNYSNLTIKRLFALSGNQCAFPDCPETLLKSDTENNLSNICHIEDANPGDRYNDNMTDKERAHYDNLILLCPTHHVETNDKEKYSVVDLKQMKRNHESAMQRKRISESNPLAERPSLLSDVINHISSLESLDNPIQSQILNAYSIEEKIRFNQVVEYKPIIEEYKVYQGKLNSIYTEMEQQASFKKVLLLEKIRLLYLRAKGKVLMSNTDTVQANADRLMREVENSLWDTIDQSANLAIDTSIEAINLGLSIVMVDAFMRCKILEEPPGV